MSTFCAFVSHYVSLLFCCLQFSVQSFCGSVKQFCVCVCVYLAKGYMTAWSCIPWDLHALGYKLLNYKV